MYYIYFTSGRVNKLFNECEKIYPRNWLDGPRDTTVFKTGMQTYNNVESKTNKILYEFTICSKCKKRSVDPDNAYTCFNGHLMCFLCFKYFKKAGEDLICSRCNRIIQRKNSILSKQSPQINVPSRTTIIEKNCSRTEQNVPPTKIDQNNFMSNQRILNSMKNVQKSKSQTVTPSRIKSLSDEGKLERKKDNENRLEKSASYGSSDDELIGNCRYVKTPSTPLTFNQSTYRKYIVPARPIVCPITICQRVVAATGLIPHFEFEHNEVSVIEVVPGEQFTLIVNPDQILDEAVRCICLFTLTTIGKPKYISGPNTTTYLKDSPARTILVPFSMMIARLFLKFASPDKNRCTHQSSGENKKHVYHCTLKDLGFLAIWVCGFDSSPEVYYSLEATYNNYRTQACMYSGPVTSLREPQNPKELIKRGECLLLAPGLTTSLCQDTGSLDINVVFH